MNKLKNILSITLLTTSCFSSAFGGQRTLILESENHIKGIETIIKKHLNNKEINWAEIFDEEEINAAKKYFDQAVQEKDLEILALNAIILQLKNDHNQCLLDQNIINYLKEELEKHKALLEERYTRTQACQTNTSYLLALIFALTVWIVSLTP